VSQRRIAVAALVIVGSLGWVAAKGLTGNLVYYQTPTELLSGGGQVGERIRVGGLVAPGSVQRGGDTVRFILTDQTTRLTVVGPSSLPALFRDGRGVVVEGAYRTDGAFHADTVLVKHSDSYRPPGPGETPAYQAP
jgi:cytochrome c-type biogenesis protein CcmE